MKFNEFFFSIIFILIFSFTFFVYYHKKFPYYEYFKHIGSTNYSPSFCINENDYYDAYYIAKKEISLPEFMILPIVIASDTIVFKTNWQYNGKGFNGRLIKVEKKNKAWEVAVKQDY